MKTRQKLTDHISTLESARDEAVAAGAWDHVDYLGECIDEARQELTEVTLIEAIKFKPNHQVFPGSTGRSVTVAITRANGVAQISVWLGRSSTIETLRAIASA